MGRPGRSPGIANNGCRGRRHGPSSGRRTLDPRPITPKNRAPASLYAYTPWVLVNRGGNWLVWSVTRKYVRHAIAKGLLPAA